MDNQMDIMLKADFRVEIPGIAYGYGHRAYANASNWVLSNYRDVDQVEPIMKWIKNVLTSKRISEPMVTFSTYWNFHEQGYFRVIRESEGYRIIYWNDRGKPKEDIHTAKYPTKEIKKMYLKLADIVIEKNAEIKQAG